MKKIILFLSVTSLFLGFALNSASSDDDRSGQNKTTVSSQCQSFFSWYNLREQKLIKRLSSNKKYERYGTAREILRHPQNHIPTVIAKAIDVASEGKLYNTSKDIGKVVLNKVDDDEGMFEKYEEACNEKVNLKNYKYAPELRIEGAFTLGNFARMIYLNNQAAKCDDVDGTQHRLNLIINIFKDCLTPDTPYLIESACAEASGNTYSKELTPILLSIVNDSNSNPVVVLASARSLTQINSMTGTTSTTNVKANIALSDPPQNYVTPDMVNSAWNYLKQLIPNTY